MSWRFEDDLSRLRERLEPDERSVRRLRARVQSRPLVPGGRRLMTLVPTLAVALALLWLLLPRALDECLDSPAAWRDQALTSGLDLRFQGRGQATGARAAPLIRWETGTVDLDVEPEAGLVVRVQTEEAEVLVLGTRFSVARDELGTEVSVERGRVSVTCSEGTSRFLVAGQRLHCAPSAAAALALVRANPTREPAELLDILHRALARPEADEAVRDELRFLTLEPLLALGRDREALAAAEAALQTGAPPRWRALRATAARLRVAEGDCAGALPHLEALAELDDPVALSLLADCVADQDPARAIASVERALARPLPEAQRASLEARLDVWRKKAISSSGTRH